MNRNACFQHSVSISFSVLLELFQRVLRWIHNDPLAVKSGVLCSRINVPSDCRVNVPPPRAGHSPLNVFENVYSKTLPLTDANVISHWQLTVVLLISPQILPAAHPDRIVTRMFSLRFASSVKLIVPAQLPAKRSAGLDCADDAQLLTNRLISKTMEANKSLVFILISISELVREL